MDWGNNECHAKSQLLLDDPSRAFKLTCIFMLTNCQMGELQRHYFDLQAGTYLYFCIMAEYKNPWKTLKGRMVYENPWIRVDEYNVINPKGGKGIYGKISFKGRAVGIIPLDNDMNTWLVGQYRYTLNEYSWEIPMGAVPTDESFETGARRELKEETGLSANHLEFLCKIHTSNSVTDEVGYAYLATGLSLGETDFDETEDLAIKKVPFKDALEMVLDGRITDSLSVAAIYKLARLKGL